MKSAVLFDNLGPYHLARLRAAASVAEVLAVEFGARSVNYDWNSEEAPVRVETLNPNGSSWELSKREFKEKLDAGLREFGPDVVFVPGWATPGAFLGLEWCLRNRVPAVLMSESTAWDAPRNPVREAMKRWVLSHFSAALVGGQPQRDYVLELGMPAERVFTGYNIVDNALFEAESDRERRCAPEDRREEMEDGGATMAEGGGRRTEGARRGAPMAEGGGRRTEGARRGVTMAEGGGRRTEGAYFLASSRFILKKNLFALVEEYAKFCAARAAQEMEDRRSKIGGSGERGAGSGEQGERGGVWPLVLLGDGELKEQLVRRIGELGLRVEFRAPWEVPLADGGGRRADGGERREGRVAPGDRRSEIEDSTGAPRADGGGRREGRVAPGDRRSESGERMEADGERMADGGERMADGGERMEADGERMADGGERMEGLVAPGDRRLEIEDRMAEGGGRRAGNGVVFLPGFRQVEELPRFYAGAGAFVHASLSEQWGLVVNEAMACALPVLVSDRCGCAKDLVQDGVNGYTFVVYPMTQLAEKFSLIFQMDPKERLNMGLRGREIIKGWGAEAFAKGFSRAAKTALAAPRKSRSFFSRAVLEAFCARQLR